MLARYIADLATSADLKGGVPLQAGKAGRLQLVLPPKSGHAALAQQAKQSAIDLMRLSWKSLWPTEDSSKDGYSKRDAADFLRKLQEA